MGKKGRHNFLCQQCDTDIYTLYFYLETFCLLYLHELCTTKKIRIIKLVKHFFVTTCQVLFCQAMKGYFLNMAHICK